MDATSMASQLLFVPTNTVLKRCLACQTFNKMSAIQQWELFIHTYIHFKSMLTTSCTNASVERCLSKMVVLQMYLRNHCGEERLNCSCY